MKTHGSTEFLRIITALPLVIVLLAFAADWRSGHAGVDPAMVASAQLELPGEGTHSPCF